MAGWILCDGRAVSVADYPELYAIIGNRFGGNGVTFNVPNLKDKFLQGSNGNLGQEKQAGLPNIKGTMLGGGNLGNEPTYFTGVFQRIGTGPSKTGFAYENMEKYNNTVSFDASRSSSIYGNSNTVQPPSITINFFIKAKADKE